MEKRHASALSEAEPGSLNNKNRNGGGDDRRPRRQNMEHFHSRDL